MGSIYRAEDERVLREVAVKVLRPHLLADPVVRHRFMLEVRLLARLNHPEVVRLYDSGELEDGGGYLVMELLKGEPLSRVIAREGSGAPWQIAALLRQVSAALGATHRIGMIHRDIKPDNIFLLDESGPSCLVVKLLDFGIAKDPETEDKLTKTGLTVGTPRYMSPEQSRGLALDGRSDVYSLAMTVLEAMNGRRINLGDSVGEILVNIVTRALHPLSQLIPGWPEALDPMFAAALAKDAALRPTDIERWACEVAEVLEKEPLHRKGWSIRSGGASTPVVD